MTEAHQRRHYLEIRRHRRTLQVRDGCRRPFAIATGSHVDGDEGVEADVAVLGLFVAGEIEEERDRFEGWPDW